MLAPVMIVITRHKEEIMGKHPEEWLRQADYDLDTAEFIFGGERYFYTVFMCHLAIEKSLKGLYSHKLDELPPRTHNLIYLVEALKLKLPEDLYNIIFTINRVSVSVRYPDDLGRILRDYDRERTERILKSSKVVLEWIKAQF